MWLRVNIGGIFFSFVTKSTYMIFYDNFWIFKTKLIFIYIHFSFGLVFIWIGLFIEYLARDVKFIDSLNKTCNMIILIVRCKKKIQFLCFWDICYEIFIDFFTLPMYSQYKPLQFSLTYLQPLRCNGQQADTTPQRSCL